MKLTHKTFLPKQLANFSFPKKDQAIIFNTVDGIQQIKHIKFLVQLKMHQISILHRDYKIIVSAYILLTKILLTV